MDVLLYVLGIVILFAGLVLSIGLHELGHFIPAKLFGVRVGQYMIGFGPTVWSKRIGGTEYGFKAVPLGGYISMAGMYPPVRPGGAARTASTGFFDTLVQDARDRAAEDARGEGLFFRLAPWKRIIVMLGGPVMNLVLASACFAIVLCGFGIPQPSTTIGTVAECVVPVTEERNACEAADPAAPAAEAGLRPGDRVLAIDGVAIESWDQQTGIIRAAPGEALVFRIDRDGEVLELEVTPLLTERPRLEGDGTVEVGFIGIGPAYATVQQPITEVPRAMWEQTAFVAERIATLPVRLWDVAVALFGGGERDPNGLVSIVGVGRVAGEIASLDASPVADRAASLIGLVGGLNIALFVFNLIPLLPLDGGHVAGALWEAIRRRAAALFKRPDPGPVDITRLLPLTFVVTAVLGAMTVFLILADLFKPISIL